MSHWLRIHYPIIWRTQLHIMLPILLVVACVCYISAPTDELTTKTVDTQLQLTSKVAGMQVWIILLIVGWTISQFRWPLVAFNTRYKLLTWSIYFLLMLAAQLGPLIYANQSISSIATVISDADLKSDMNFVLSQQPNLPGCFSKRNFSYSGRRTWSCCFCSNGEATQDV